MPRSHTKIRAKAKRRAAKRIAQVESGRRVSSGFRKASGSKVSGSGS